MASPAFRSYTQAYTTAVTSVTPTEPAGATTDDIIVAFIYVENTNPATITPPTGWSDTFNGTTLKQDMVLSGQVWSLQAFWIRRGGSAPSYSSFSWSGSSNVQHLTAAYSGAVASGDPWSFMAGAKRDDSSTNTYPDVSGTTLTADEVLIWAGCNYVGIGTLTQPTGYTARHSTNGSDLALADKAQATATSVTSTGASSNSAGNHASILLGLRSLDTGVVVAQVATLTLTAVSITPTSGNYVPEYLLGAPVARAPFSSPLNGTRVTPENTRAGWPRTTSAAAAMLALVAPAGAAGAVTVTAQVATVTLTGVAGVITPGTVTVAAQVATLTLTGVPITPTTASTTTTTAQVADLTLTAVPGVVTAGTVTTTAQVGTLTLAGVAGTITPGVVTVTAQVGTLTLSGVAGVLLPGTVTTSAQVGTLTLTALQGTVTASLDAEPGIVCLAVTAADVTLTATAPTVALATTAPTVTLAVTCAALELVATCATVALTLSEDC